MDFTPEVEYGVIREVVSHKIERPLLNPSNKFWIKSTLSITPNSHLQTGDSLIYKN